jgi:adenylate cyclase
VGVNAGPVIFRDGDYFGRTVNVAARIADYARPGEVLVTEPVRAATGDRPLQFESLHPVPLKGVSEAVQLYRAIAPE